MEKNPVTSEELAKDGGLGSRKLYLTLLVFFLIVGAGIACNWVPALGVQLQTIVGGLLGALALYLGGNVISKFNAVNLAKVMVPLRKLAPDASTEDPAKTPGEPADRPPVETG
jgi:hypothetical protein